MGDTGADMPAFPAPPSSARALGLAGALALVVAASFAFRFIDWDEGPTRGLILLMMLGAMARLGAPGAGATVGPRLNFLVNAVIAGAAVLWLSTAVATITTSARTGAIPMDQGQTTWRAGRLLLRGENPYGFGALVDFQAYFDRMSQRKAAGLQPEIAPDALKSALQAYDSTLAAPERDAILPPAPAEGPAALEAHLLGYKYGPLFPLLALPFVVLGQPAAIMALNALVAALAVAALYVTLRERVGAPLAKLGLAALLCDNTILYNFVMKSGTDIWALLFCILAVRAVLRDRPSWGALALAIGFGFKIFPCALLFPMLLKDRRVAPAFAFAGVAAAIYAPFALADFSGLVHNVFLWPAYLGTDTTSWVAFAPPLAGRIARLLGLAAIAALWARYLLGREPSLFRVLALVALLALVTSAAFHNNYVPWASIWVIAALVERFGPSNSKSSASRSVYGPSRIFTSSGGMVEFVRASIRTRQEGKTT